MASLPRLRARVRTASATTVRPSVPRRALAGCAALLLVAAQGSNVAHLLLAPHAVCPEHGELVHAGELGAAHAPVAAAAAGSLHETAISAAHDGAADEHDDEHCAALGARREHAIIGSACPCLSAAPADAVRLPANAGGAGHEARARYDVAPKQSPPA
jgi:hypothetical protein